MCIAVAITNHNQNRQVKKTIDFIMSCDIRPDKIYVMSDDKPFNPIKKYQNIVVINNDEKTAGRYNNRNSVIKPFLKTELDSIVFIDGDCIPDSKDFIKNYALLLENYDLIFGTRRHTDVSGLKNPPSDLLTANMDNMFHNKKLNYTDLRLVSGAVSAWRESKKFNEKLDLMLTGMIGWSCNFGFSRKGLLKLRTFQKDTYGLDEGIFDS